VKPAGTVGMTEVGLSTKVPKLGLGTPTGDSLSATGCGGTVGLCPTSTAQKPATPMATVAEIRQSFEPWDACGARQERGMAFIEALLS